MSAELSPPVSALDPVPVSGFDHDPSIWADPAGRRGPRLRGAAASHVGYYRDNNEDRFLVRPDVGLFAVADGMGGHEAGEVASAMAVLGIAEAADPRPGMGIARRLVDALVRANVQIQTAAQVHAPQMGMGTTASAVWFANGRAFVAHVGDSRVYRLRAGVLEQLSDDHTLLGDAIRGGFCPEKARALLPGHVLTRALGIHPVVEPQLMSCDACPGDRFLLCSDGLSDLLDDAGITELLERWAAPTHAAHALMNAALAAGGNDNVTVLVVDVG